jgi:hypothetical protein
MTLILSGTDGLSDVDGSAATPAIRGTDTNTGFYFPAADQIAASLGGSPAWSASSTFGFKNRIINGAMVIDQRNAGASVTPTNSQYLVDRWQASLTQASKYTAQQNAGSVTPPVGFTKYLGFTSSSAYSVTSGDIFGFGQIIEGFNAADFGWGTANAQTVTLSFWVRSSLTGSFGGAIKNDGDTRNYPFTYTISAANTWEYKTVTIAGDTTGTWGSTNGAGVNIRFSLGCGSTYSGTAGAWTGTNIWQPTGSTSVVGTNGATFYITGVQLERGSAATSFDFRSYTTELGLCQRYFQVYGPYTLEAYANGGSIRALTQLVTLPVSMRATPTRAVISAGTSSNLRAPETTYSGLAIVGTSGTTYTMASIESNATGYCQLNNRTESLSAEL